MILKVEFAQLVYNHHKHNLRKPKEGLSKKEATSFASVFKNVIKAQSAGR